MLTTRSVDITGVEPLDPVKATLHGVVRSLRLEAPELSCRLIDVASPYTDEELAAEIVVDAAEPVVALRGPTRWERIERPYRGAAGSVPPLRRGGVYVLTGGLGGLGLAVAREMAATGLAPHLVLVGRRGLDPAPPVPAGLGAVDPAAARVRAALTDLARLGATVRVEACDIADRRSTRRLFETIRAHLGPVHGVVHLAGVPGDGMLLGRDRAEAEAVLRPKVAGTLVLAELLGEHPPVDFMVSFSSRAALGGLVGGADYAAANAFLDAQSRLMARTGLPALTVNWPAWHTVGMAADPLPTAETVEDRSWSIEVSLDNWPILDEHRIGTRPVMPGTGHLDLIVRAFGAVIGGGQIVLSDVVLERPLAVPQSRRVTVTFRPKDADWSFTLTSATRDGTGVMRHVTGSAGVLTTEPAVATEKLADVRQRLVKPAEENPDAVSLVTFGPRWDNIVRMTTDPDSRGELLVEAALPAPFHADLAGHRLHPALLDSATAEATHFGSGALQPFCYRRLEVYANLPAVIFSHLRERPASRGLVVADIDIYAVDGRLLVRIDGFTMRRVAGPPALEAAQPAEVPQLDEGLTGATPAAPSGIDPVAGARLFLLLLGQRHPYQVAVRPHRAGRPVPIAGEARWTDAAVRAPIIAAPAGPDPTGTAVPPAPAPQAVTVHASSSGTADADPAVTGVEGTVKERLVALWTDVLGVSAIADGDDFFSLGGNSLSAVELMSRIKEAFGVRLGVVAMFDQPTLGGFARALAAEGVS
ncbi:SDR family NAD(P)-dependent oxidoreductase [Micromonospora lupini]|uniref:SDR family NAD(P)-dependent oxidoreductase n=1 Tax=Micromonospora lupini TaxID=285679 RepID=UPI0033E5F167